MTMLQHGLVPSTGGYQVERSLRFNSDDSAYLNRTLTTPTNRRISTFSAWIKRGTLTNSTLFSAAANGSTFDDYIDLSSNKLRISFNAGSSYALTTTQVFRDVSAWYHIVIAIDTTQATESNRVKFYVNGLQITAFDTALYPVQNYDPNINSAISHNIGTRNPAQTYLNGYLTDVHFIDGQALTPSSFGENDTDTGVWKPKAYTGSYGTNGFKLTFSDNSGTTSTTLGKDTSGNGNNWTPNNFSVTAGAGNDSLVDTPTPYGTDTGAGGEVRGNYCTLNPLANNGGTLANGNLDHTGTTAITTNTLFPTSGKWYCELTCTAYGGGGSFGYTAVGAIQSSQSINSIPNSIANVPAGLWIYRNDGVKANNGASASYGNTWTANDVIGIAIDIDAGKLWFAKNGTWQASGDPAAGTNAAYTNLSGAIGVAINDQGSYSSSYSCNFGQRPFAYTAPSGFKALCTTNLPTPTIGATSSTRADDYFNTLLWTGDGSYPRTITGVGFQPDFVWTKSRSSAFSHISYDVVRGTGTTKSLSQNETSAEGANSSNANLTAFTSDGFTVDSTTGTNVLNKNLDTFVAWNWKANGAGSSNTAGSITSTVSANTTAGFSIVTYTGNGTNGATVGHGLGVAPSMIIIKGRSTAYDWIIYHSGIGNTKFLDFTTAAASTNSVAWNNTSPSSTVFTLGTAARSNENNATHVAYCFAQVAGYSAFGSYTGNGSADGPFVYTGFRPRYVMIKRTDTTNWWEILDTSRSPYNVADKTLYANVSDAEYSGSVYAKDFLSNGFKVRGTDAGSNASGGTYIYAAFAEVPQKFSLAR